MSQQKYNRMQKNPLKKQWEVMGVALLSSIDAQVLNDSTQHTGIKYEIAEKPKKTIKK